MTARKPQRKSEKGEQLMTANIQVDLVRNCAECCGLHPVESCPRFVNLRGRTMTECPGTWPVFWVLAKRTP
ncbi:hypothetical protein T01_11206 [Trichinella spiralis]|uniref:Uncharacterized protein n=1 Tax=Trichinella spiralis TaxID=6334 RepID=A0A0V1ASS3_TRISP|nr:hypothetical protein T01_11206 [Trichinella spiralis]